MQLKADTSTRARLGGLTMPTWEAAHHLLSPLTKASLATGAPRKETEAAVL